MNMPALAESKPATSYYQESSLKDLLMPPKGFLLSEPGIIAYVNDFGVDPGKLSDQQLTMFMYARKFEALLRELPLPVAQEINRNNCFVQVEKEVTRQIPKTTLTDSLKETEVPSNNLDFSLLLDRSNLPKINCSEWLKDDISPDLFLQQLAAGKLLQRQWLEPTQDPVTSFETITEKKLVLEPAPPIIQRPNAYVLLDVSGSMEEEAKFVKGCALALGFLHIAHEKRAQMFARTFTTEVSEEHKGVLHQDLSGIAKWLIEQSPNGYTDIQKALEAAVSDIQEQNSGRPSDILLITDGLSKLKRNPLRGMRLHTLSLDNPDNYSSSDGDFDFDKNLKKLRTWSTTFKFIQDDYSDRFLNPRLVKDDLKEIKKTVECYGDGIAGAKKDDKESAVLLRKLKDLLKIVSSLESFTEKGSESDSLTAQKFKIENLIKELEENRIEKKFRMNPNSVSLPDPIKEEEPEVPEELIQHPPNSDGAGQAPSTLKDFENSSHFSLWRWIKGRFTSFFNPKN